MTGKCTNILDAIFNANQLIATAEIGGAFKLYECLHRIAERIACADAFYICLYDADNQSLFFPYNCDNGVYDPPSTFPMGDGPTSQAIQRNEAIVWNTEHEARQFNRVRFGNVESYTLSAAHLPIRDLRAGAKKPLLGVLSAHSYRPGIYGDMEVQAYQWLADRAGEALMRAQARLLEAEQQQRAEWITDQCVQIINCICGDAQAIQTLVRPNNKALQEAMFALIRSCHRYQTDVNQLPLRSKELFQVAPALAAPPSDDCLALATSRERQILRLLALGHTNEEIGQELYIATNTVKDHLKRIYYKLGVHNRFEAVHLFKSAS